MAPVSSKRKNNIPPGLTSKIKNKKIKSQAREMVHRVYTFMKRESDELDLLIAKEQVHKRCAVATGVSEKTVQRIIKEHDKVILTSASSAKNVTFITPDKSRNKKKTVTDIDSFDEGVIRRTILDFYIYEKCCPTIEKLRKKLQDSINFKGSERSLRRVVKRIGFKWKRTENNRKLLIEKDDIKLKRVNYLRELMKFRREGRPIVFTDESYIVTSHLNSKSWTDDSNEGLKKPINKGERLIFIHAGGEDGFVPDAFLLWKAAQKTGDYHDQMNHENFKKWLLEKLIPNLKPGTVVIIDNAPYHNNRIDKIPTSNSRKDDMKAWLREKNIPFPETFLKVQLYELIKKYKPMNIKYQIDQLLEEHGHTVLRLPPYHPDLNPIETVWAMVKNWVAANNTTFKLTDIKDLTNKRIAEITAEDWKRICKHVNKIEEEYIQKDFLMDDMEVREFIIPLTGSDDSSDQNSDSDDDPNEDFAQQSDSGSDISGVEPLT